MTTKLQCILFQGRGMGEQVGGLGEQLVTKEKKNSRSKDPA
jgi:hypothetical protein